MKIIDISKKIENNMKEYPGHPPVNIDSFCSLDKDGRNIEKISLGSHFGTHLDAPLHFIEEGDAINNIRLDSLIGNVLLIDLSHKKQGDVIEKSDLIAYKEKIRKIKKIIIMTNWNEKGNSYYNDHPYISTDCCEFLCDLNVNLIGLDTPSPGPKGKLGEDIHKKILKNNIIIIEGLTNLKSIEREVFLFVCLPLNISGTGGSPCRAIALIDKNI